MYETQGPGDPVKMSQSETDLAADAWTREGNTRAALEHALRAIELDPDNADAHHLTALLYLDFCRTSEIGECRLDEAEKHARLALAKKKRFLEATNTLAVILIHQERYVEAEQVLLPLTQDILYATPEIAWGNLGWSYLGQKKPEKAIPALRRAVAAQPKFCVGNYRLGVAYHRSGALESAVDALNRAVETEAPGCSGMQDAFLERAEVYLALEDETLCRADLAHCVELSKSTDSGRKCSALLNNLD
jgi:type IV pilus assembly protein PilF